MEERAETKSNLEVYRNYTDRTEKYFAKKFWPLAAVFAVLVLLQSFLPFSWPVRTLLFTAILGNAIVFWQLYSDCFETKREMKVVLSVHSIMLIVLNVGLGVAIWFTMV